jgi:Tfp pilus assembly protein PilO
MALTVDDKPWWVGLLVGLGLAAAVVYGAETLFVKKVKADIENADAEIEALDQKISQGRAAERKLPQFREEVKRLELELDKLRRILPSTRNTEEIIKKLKSLVDQGEFVWRNLAFPALAASSEDPYVEWPISVAVEGRYHDLAILFSRLSNFSRIINVENIKIGALSDQTTRTISADFVAKTFVYVELSSEATDTAQPGGAK